MSAEFKLPDNIDASDVKVYEVPCTGVNADGSYTFGDQTKLKDAVVSINKVAGTVSVSGFDYSKKYINKDATDEVKGYKLLIEFPVEYKNDAWFGGNDIESNDIGSGIYNGGSCYGTFEVPKVNRAIDYEITAKDQTIYVTNPANLQELLDYAVKDSKTYKPDGKNNKYVNIVYTLKDANGNEIGTFTIKAGQTAAQGTWASATGQTWNPELKDCTTYTWTCTVTPNKSDGKSLGVAGTGHDAAEETKFDGDKAKQGTVHVLYPTVNARDEFIYWGETIVPNSLITVADNWTDLNGNHTTGTPMETKPQIEVNAKGETGGAGNTPSKDSDYNVVVKLNGADKTELLKKKDRIKTAKEEHKNCDDITAVTSDKTSYDFRIHVKVKKLTVVKKVTGNMGDTNQEFEFKGTNVHGANADFKLKDNGEQQFKLKVGEEAKITETAAAGYETDISVNPTTAGSTSGRTYTYDVKRESPDAVTVTYTNKKQINPPNGIITTIAPYAIMVVLAAGAGVYFVYSRRRRNR